MLVEFLGLPGAGKSTLSHLVANLLLERRYTVEETTYDLDRRFGKFERSVIKLAHIARYLCTHPRCALSNVSSILATRQATLADIKKSIPNWLYVASLVSRRRSDDRIILLDQGVAQAVWSIGFAAEQELWLDLHMNTTSERTPKPDLIIQVQASFETVSVRLDSRKKRISRLESLVQNHSVLQHAQDHCDEISLRFEAAGVPIIKVHNDDPEQLASNARLVTDIIIAFVNEQTAASRERPQGAPLSAPQKRASPIRGL
ncbi:hypothetical protein [Microvirga terricola]|uniref:Thymidylate kinase n=1 Tax=Microvirga terricola TaxID=2719797 RepID=A0ABX0VI15_9HYPH|nr:hypothetical protein [Microvirga terricola]NIX78087.1 hypothetical protein [Microvirga terricola]